jgi:hypothetical protein
VGGKKQAGVPLPDADRQNRANYAGRAGLKDSFCCAPFGDRACCKADNQNASP